MVETETYSISDEDEVEDAPPMSRFRLFVSCNKTHSEEDLRRGFQKYGKIEDITVVKATSTGDNKIAYIEFSKTSEAALAQEEMNGKRLADYDRPLKVIVERKREEDSRRAVEDSPDKYTRLFLTVPEDMTEESLKEEFEEYGCVDNAQIVRDGTTGESKGVAYVKFKRFYSAAVAYENCPATYKAVFASAKLIAESSSQSLDPSQSNTSSLGSTGSSRGQPSALDVICSNEVNRDQLWRLFDLVPGLDYCQINGEDGPNCEATVIYTNKDSAEYARNNVSGVEYPPGHRLTVKFADGNIVEDTLPKPRTRGGKQQILKKTVKLYNELLGTRLTAEEIEKYTIMLNKSKKELNKLKRHRKRD